MECHSVGDDLKYFIYCQMHRPLQFMKLLEIKNQKKREEIIKYALYIEKYVLQMMKNKSKSFSFTKILPLDSHAKSLLNKKRKKLPEPQVSNSIELTKLQVSKVFTKVKDIYNKLIHRDISFKFKEKSQTYEVNKKAIPYCISFNDIFDKDKFPWYLVNFKDITPKTAYNFVGKTCSDESTFKKLILGINVDSYKKKEIVNTPENKEITLYCYCQKNYNEDSFMIGCSNDSSCKYNGWFHPCCVKELNGKSKEEIEDENFEFTCEDCKKMLENEENQENSEKAVFSINLNQNDEELNEDYSNHQVANEPDQIYKSNNITYEEDSFHNIDLS